MGAAKLSDDTDKVLRVGPDGDKTPARRQADISRDPVASAAATVLLFSKGTFGSSGITETFEGIRDMVEAVRKGDLAGPEAMLVTQADSLSAIFTELARRSALNMGEYINASERYMRLALKAQAQCRATIETLAALKNPPVVIARQANISNGPQQVNNGPAPRADESLNQPNELLEHHVEPRMDLGAAAAPGRSNPRLVAVEAVHRA